MREVQVMFGRGFAIRVSLSVPKQKDEKKRRNSNQKGRETKSR